jgi:hypothetical protein
MNFSERLDPLNQSIFNQLMLNLSKIPIPNKDSPIYPLHFFKIQIRGEEPFVPQIISSNQRNELIPLVQTLLNRQSWGTKRIGREIRELKVIVYGKKSLASIYKHPIQTVSIEFN